MTGGRARPAVPPDLVGDSEGDLVRHQLSERGWRREVWAFVELFALCGFAITQPLLSVFGGAVDHLVFRGATGYHVVIFGVAVTFLPAVLLWLVEVGSSVFGPSTRRVVHVVLLAVLGAMVFVQVARSVILGPLLVVVGLAFCGLAYHAFSNWPAARLWARFAALAPPVFLVLFLSTSAAATLIDDSTSAIDAPVSVGSPAPVVMVVLDELPLVSLLASDGSVDADLYPNFAALAADSHWFRNTTTMSTATWYAVPSILSGKYPENGTSPVAAVHDETLFTLLGGAYDMQVIESVTRLCPTSLCPLEGDTSTVLDGLYLDARRVMAQRLAPSESTEDPVAGFARAAAANAEVPEYQGSEPERFQSLIDGLSGSDQTTLHYAHILYPHIPFTWLPSGHSYRSPDPDIGRLVDEDEWNDQVWPPTLGRQRHVLQLQFLDGLLGQLMDELKAEGLYDDALVVVVADHGASFEAGQPIRALRGQPLDQARRADLLWVPFFLKEPGQVEGQVHDSNVLTVDVLPTIADVLDVEIPFGIDGRSALSDPRGSAEKVYFGLRHMPGPGPRELLGPFTLDGDEDLPVVLERSVGEFLTAVGDPLRQWRIGPAPELVGRSVADVSSTGMTEVDAVIEQVEEGALALVQGRLEGVEVGSPLAVAVDDVVAATVITYLEGDHVAFAAMVDVSFFSDRDPDIGIYVID